jgi:Protein of unknown function (Hypoth_ymh)
VIEHHIGLDRPLAVTAIPPVAVYRPVSDVGAVLRQMGGRDEDGPRLVESVLEGTDPMIRLDDRANQSQRDEQRGVAVMEGLFAASRNPRAQ